MKSLHNENQNGKQPELKVKKGVLYKYAKTVTTAAEGCVTDEN
jgi:dihydroxy-acid dehydratase